jgi:hypothetical protein
VFAYISVVVMESACVRDFRRLGLCAVVTVGSSVGGEYVGERDSVGTGWQRIGGGGEDEGESR